MEKHRSERLAETLREELEEIINYELEDPRIGGVRVTEVLLSRDSRRADIQCLMTAGSDGDQGTLRALDHAKHHIRELLTTRLGLFRTPELRFEADAAQEVQKRAKYLLRRVRKGRPRGEEPQFTSTAKENPLK